MEKQVIIEALKKLGNQALVYAKTELWAKVVEAGKEAGQHFVNTLWDSIKDEVHSQLHSAIQFITYYFDTEDAKEKEEMVIEVIMKNIKLPVVLKPFRGIVKRILRSKLEKVVREAIKKLNTIA